MLHVGLLLAEMVTRRRALILAGGHRHRAVLGRDALLVRARGHAVLSRAGSRARDRGDGAPAQTRETACSELGSELGPAMNVRAL